MNNTSHDRITRAAVMRFHARHKFLLMARSPEGTRKLGNLAATGGNYFSTFFEVMRCTPSRRSHTNVLQHLAGYFTEMLDSDDRAELTMLIENYRLGRIPLSVPAALIRYYVRKFNVPYLRDQVYLQQHSDQLMLLNSL